MLPDAIDKGGPRVNRELSVTHPRRSTDLPRLFNHGIPTMPHLSSDSSLPAVRAIDIGHGRTKFTVDERGTCREFPSLAPAADANHAGTSIHRARRTTVVHVEGDAFEVGPDSILFRRHDSVLHDDYIETRQYRALLFGALQEMGVSAIDMLVTGLPVLQHAPKAKRLQEILRGVHSIRPGICVEIRDVAVVVQPLGGFLAYCHERGTCVEREKLTCLVVDPGYVTVDWLVARGLSELPGRSGHIEGGVAEYLSRLQEHLNLELGTTLANLQAIDEGLRHGGFRLNGKAVDLESHRAPAQTVVDRAVDAIRNSIGSALDIDEILVVGGGGCYFLDRLKAAFPDRPVHQNDLFANVRGFHLIGKILRKRSCASAR